jgi:hypothetical protein
MRGATPLAVYSLDGPRSIPGVDASDHASYWAEGWPAVLITDTAWYRNRAYHTADDRAARLDYHRLAMVVQATRAAVDALTR